MIEVRFDFPIKSKQLHTFPAMGTVTLQMNAERIESKNEGGNCVFRVASTTDLSEHFTIFTDSAKELKRVKEERDCLQEHLREVGPALGFTLGTRVLDSIKFLRNELIDMGKAIGIHNPEMMPTDVLVKHLREVVSTYFKSGLLDGPGNGLLYNHRKKLFALIYGMGDARQATSLNVEKALEELDHIMERQRTLEKKSRAFDEFIQLDREIVELNRQSMERRKLQRAVVEEYRR